MATMLRRLITSVLVVPGLVAGVAVTGAARAEAPSPRWLTRPCTYEDSVNCYWDATVQGTGTGQSFFAVRVRDEVCVLYADDRYARRHNRCVPAPRR